MVGLSIVLEGHKDTNKRITSPVQVVNKVTCIIKPSSHHHHHPHAHPHPHPHPCAAPAVLNYFPATTTSTSSFLDRCFLCKHKLLPGKDIYMYKGDRAFCSVECRCKQMFMDEEETFKRDNCSLAAIKLPLKTTSSSSPSHNRRGTRNRANGFAY